MFEFGRKIGIETFMSEPKLEALLAAEKKAAEKAAEPAPAAKKKVVSRKP